MKLMLNEALVGPNACKDENSFALKDFKELKFVALEMVPSLNPNESYLIRFKCADFEEVDRWDRALTRVFGEGAVKILMRATI